MSLAAKSKVCGRRKVLRWSAGAEGSAGAPSSRAWQHLSDGVACALTQPLGEADLVLHYEVASPIGPLGVRQALPRDATLAPWLHNVCGGHAERAALQGGRADRRATQGLGGGKGKGGS